MEDLGRGKVFKGITMKRERICVIGAGSWGTTVAIMLADKGYNIHLWVYEEELWKLMLEERENPWYLPDVKIPSTVKLYNNLIEAIGGSDVIINALPSHAVKGIFSNIRNRIGPEAFVISLSKGFDPETHQTPSRVLASLIPSPANRRICVVSGPSFAREVAKKLPTAVVSACTDLEWAKKAQELLSTPYFRVYINRDITGVEIGGALKNIIAIAAGISDGLELGYNAKAALIARGLMEMMRFAAFMGAEPLTLCGLSGMGDLVLTCTGQLSRNYSTGIELGRGRSLKDIISSRRGVIEGIGTTRIVREISQRMGIEMPITNEVYEILFLNKPPRAALATLLSRQLKEELDFPREVWSPGE